MASLALLPAELTDHLDEIRALCGRYGIRALYVFGSAVHGTFDPATSDLDFAADLGDYGDDVARRYFGFISDLRNTLGRDIDVITTRSVGYERFLDEVSRTRVLLHAA